MMPIPDSDLPVYIFKYHIYTFLININIFKNHTQLKLAESDQGPPVTKQTHYMHKLRVLHQWKHLPATLTCLQGAQGMG